MFLHWSSGSSNTTVWEIINYRNNNISIHQTGSIIDSFNGVVRFGSNFVACTGTGYIYYSSTGDSWTEITPATSGLSGCQRVFLGNGVVCFEEQISTTKYVTYTSDLSSFTTETMPDNRRTFYLNGYYYQYTGSNNAQKSTDLSTWTTFTTTLSNPIEAVYANSLYVAIGDNAMYSSTDGESWTDRTPSSPNDPLGPGNESLAYGGGVWLITGYYTDDTLYYSTNGTTWTADTSYQPDLAVSFDGGGSEAIYTNSTFYVANGVTDIAYNTNPSTTSWQGVNITNITLFNDIGGNTDATITLASDGTRIIGVGFNGLIARYVL